MIANLTKQKQDTNYAQVARDGDFIERINAMPPIHTKLFKSSLSRHAHLAATTNVCNKKSFWYLFSGASAQMINNKELLTNYQELKYHDTITIGNGKKIKIIGKGTMKALLYDHLITFK